MKKRVFAFALVLLLLMSLSVSALAASEDMAKDVCNSVVRVYVEYEINYYDYNYNYVGSGSGVGWGSAFAVGYADQPVSYFVTNRHVVSESVEDLNGHIAECIPTALYIILDNEATLHPIDVVTQNPGGADLAIVKLKEPTTQRVPVHLYDYPSAESVRGITVFTLGFPSSASVFVDESHEFASGPDQVSFRRGQIDHEIDGLHTSGDGTLLLNDAPSSSGNSGGPLVEEHGAVVGVNTMGAVEDANMNAAVSVKEVIKLLNMNNVPYMVTSDPSTIGSEEPEEKESNYDWLLYALLGVAIVGVLAVLIVVLRKPKKEENHGGNNLSGGNLSGGGISAGSPIEPVNVIPPEPVNVAPPEPATQVKRYLIGVEGPLKDKRFTLESGKSLVLGRNERECNVVFPKDAPGVSSLHCKIRFDGKKATIEDLGSTYGTAVDGKKLLPNTPVTLHRGLAIEIGGKDTVFTLQ